MPDVATPVAESSTAIAPQDPDQYATWRQTGKLPDPPAPAAAPNTEASAASSNTSEADGAGPIGHPAAAESETASEAGTNRQEQRVKPRGTAETRLTDLLADLKRAGLTPAELKTFKREAQQQQQRTESTAAAPPVVAKPPEAPKPLVAPKIADFESLEKYDEANQQYLEQLADRRAEAKFVEREARVRADDLQRATNVKMDAAKVRYGDTATDTIKGAAVALANDQQIPESVKAIISDSPVMVDMLYVVGSKPEELAEFIALAKANPNAAIRKAVLLEQLVTEELAKGAKTAPAAGAAAAETPARGESGQFVATGAAAKTPPAKKTTEAPPPPREAGGRSAAPPDELERAATELDFRAHRELANRRDLARFNGR
jgi:hypothetical protein